MEERHELNGENVYNSDYFEDSEYTCPDCEVDMNSFEEDGVEYLECSECSTSMTIDEYNQEYRR